MNPVKKIQLGNRLIVKFTKYMYILYVVLRLDRQISELGQNSEICMVFFSYFRERENITSLKIFITFYENLVT